MNNFINKIKKLYYYEIKGNNNQKIFYMFLCNSTVVEMFVFIHFLGSVP